MLSCFTCRYNALLFISALIVAAACAIPIPPFDQPPPATANPSDSITVHLIPHSHCDPGWLLTADQYFSTQVGSIIDTVVAALLADPSRRFIWSEVSYFTMWWRSADDSSRARFKSLVDSGALEMVMGGWVMNDEALPSLDAIIDQCAPPFSFAACVTPHITRPDTQSATAASLTLSVLVLFTGGKSTLLALLR
jgi:hypothetical protein